MADNHSVGLAKAENDTAVATNRSSGIKLLDTSNEWWDWDWNIKKLMAEEKYLDLLERQEQQLNDPEEIGGDARGTDGAESEYHKNVLGERTRDSLRARDYSTNEMIPAECWKVDGCEKKYFQQKQHFDEQQLRSNKCRSLHLAAVSHDRRHVAQGNLDLQGYLSQAPHEIYNAIRAQYNDYDGQGADKLHDDFQNACFTPPKGFAAFTHHSQGIQADFFDEEAEEYHQSDGKVSELPAGLPQGATVTAADSNQDPEIERGITVWTDEHLDTIQAVDEFAAGNSAPELPSIKQDINECESDGLYLSATPITNDGDFESDLSSEITESTYYTSANDVDVENNITSEVNSHRTWVRSRTKLGLSIDSHSLSPQAMVVLTSTEQRDQYSFLCDSGATITIVNNKDFFMPGDFHKCSCFLGTAVDPQGLKVVGKGAIKLRTTTRNGESRIITIEEVFYCPDAQVNLLAIQRLADTGLETRVMRGGCLLIDAKTQTEFAFAPVNSSHHAVLAVDIVKDEEPPQKMKKLQKMQETQKINEVQKLKGISKPFPSLEDQDVYGKLDSKLSAVTSSVAQAAVAGASEEQQASDEVVDMSNPVMMWHRRLGHIELDNMIKLLDMSSGITLEKKDIEAFLKTKCPICETTKVQNRVPKEPALRTEKEAGVMIHADIWQHSRIAITGERYVLAITDDASRYTWIKFLERKSEIFDAFKALFLQIQLKTRKEIGKLRCDSEIISSKKMKEFVTDKGVEIELVSPKTHYQNGIAERNFRTLRERSSAMVRDATLAPRKAGNDDRESVAKRIFKLLDARTKETLKQSSITLDLWPLAYEHAVWIKNRSPTRALGRKQTPWQFLTGHKPDFKHEAIWGSRIYVPTSGQQLNKDLSKAYAQLKYFVGFESEGTMKTWDPETRKIETCAAKEEDDGTGLRDPQPGKSLRDDSTAAQGNASSSESDDEVEGDAEPFRMQNHQS